MKLHLTIDMLAEQVQLQQEIARGFNRCQSRILQVKGKLL